MQVRYQAALRPELTHYNKKTLLKELPLGLICFPNSLLVEEDRTTPSGYACHPSKGEELIYQGNYSPRNRLP